MFRRKDDDIAQDLLGNADTGSSNEPKIDNNSSNASNAKTGNSEMTSAPKTATPAQPSAYARSGTPQSVETAPQQPATPTTAPFRTASDYNRNRSAASGPAASNAVSPQRESTATPKSGSRRVLTVGHDILLKGEIATCDRLVIEGEVDATLNEVHTVEIAETGSFKGDAKIEDAEISGIFEGDLVVRNRLVIYSTGKVNGKITYGEIEIERGGELSGEIRTIASAATKSSKVTAKTKEAA